MKKTLFISSILSVLLVFPFAVQVSAEEEMTDTTTVEAVETTESIEATEEVETTDSERVDLLDSLLEDTDIGVVGNTGDPGVGQVGNIEGGMLNQPLSSLYPRDCNTVRNVVARRRCTSAKARMENARKTKSKAIGTNTANLEEDGDTVVNKIRNQRRNTVTDHLQQIQGRLELRRAELKAKMQEKHESLAERVYANQKNVTEQRVKNVEQRLDRQTNHRIFQSETAAQPGLMAPYNQLKLDRRMEFRDTIRGNNFNTQTSDLDSTTPSTARTFEQYGSYRLRSADTTRTLQYRR